MANINGKGGGAGDGGAPLTIGARQITVIGVLTAMIVITTVFTRIPLVIGYFNLGDTFVLLAGALFGGFTGAFTGAVGSALADILTGSYIFAPITFIVKGAEGYLAGRVSGGGIANNPASDGLLSNGGVFRARPNAKAGGGMLNNAKNAKNVRGRGRSLTLALIAGASVMIIGYFIAESTVLTLFDRAFGLSAAITELPFNLAQGAISVALTRVVIEGLKRTRVL